MCSNWNFKYLGLMHIYEFGHHLRIISAKAAKVATALARIVPNTDRLLKQSSRSMLASVVNSTFFYTALIHCLRKLIHVVQCQSTEKMRCVWLMFTARFPMMPYTLWMSWYRLTSWQINAFERGS